MKNRGMVTYFVLVLIAFLALFLSNISILSQGEINQLARSEAVLRADIAARSAFNAFSWRLKSAGFESRPCRNAAVDEITSSDGITCELLCYDSQDEERSVDIWVLAKGAQTTRALFYRVKFVESVIGRFNRTVTIFSDSFPLEDFPTNRVSPRTPQKIISFLQNRSDNLKKNRAAVKSLEDSRNASDALARLGMGSDGNVLNVVPPLSPVKTGDDRPAPPLPTLAVKPSESDGRELLTIGALKKTDIAMQLEKATQAAGNQQSGGNAGVAVNSGGDKPQPAGFFARWTAYNKAFGAILDFGAKTLAGRASDADKARASEALQKYLGVSKNGIAAKFLSGWMKQTEKDFTEDQAKKQQKGQGGGQ